MRHAFFAFVVMGGCGGATVAVTDDGGVEAAADVRTDGPWSIDGRWILCDKPGECDIRPKSCCGTCGAPTPDDMIGVNWQKGDAYTQRVCGGTACAECFKEPDPNLAPVCRLMMVKVTCSAVDVRSDPMSECKTSQDCVLRYAGCCEPCAANDPSKLLALSVKGRAEYAANQCHPDAGACPKCAVVYPPGYEAVCNKMRHCEVAQVIADAGAGD